MCQAAPENAMIFSLRQRRQRGATQNQNLGEPSGAKTTCIRCRAANQGAELAAFALMQPNSSRRLYLQPLQGFTGLEIQLSRRRTKVAGNWRVWTIPTSKQVSKLPFAGHWRQPAAGRQPSSSWLAIWIERAGKLAACVIGLAAGRLDGRRSSQLDAPV